MEPFAYLKDILARLPDYPHTVLPTRFYKIGASKVNPSSISNHDGFTEMIDKKMMARRMRAKNHGTQKNPLDFIERFI